MKTLISILATLALSSSVVTSFAHSTPKHVQIQNKKIQMINKESDIKELSIGIKNINQLIENVDLTQHTIKELIINLFNNIKEQINKNHINLGILLTNQHNDVSKNQIENINKKELLNYIEVAKKESIQILNEINSKGIPFNEVVSYLRNHSSSFNKNYQLESTEFINKTLKQNILIPKSLSFRAISNQELLQRLKTAKVALITTSSVAAIAAAGFTAAAIFSIGLTVPFAIGSTALSAAAGVAASGIGVAINNLENNPSANSKEIVSIVANVLKILKIFTGVAATTSIFVPAASAALAVVTALIAWLEYAIK
ncbi:hypothetical protein [Williamsoniiplasma lucivorax]|uniref:Uncharacterized protein n=1 Tax=Williamsoniiplasma lucivorax TaxID=209274 RepID=A0A2S5RE32_9MOLU|nr:hypothetical protein [Williamsoniiplasma lucivorax]PPE05385.1 hypothetical protein ELUCI_v1c04770 [Williamsoniiplasma lucivorax]